MSLKNDPPSRQSSVLPQSGHSSPVPELSLADSAASSSVSASAVQALRLQLDKSCAGSKRKVPGKTATKIIQSASARKSMPDLPSEAGASVLSRDRTLRTNKSSEEGPVRKSNQGVVSYNVFIFYLCTIARSIEYLLCFFCSGTQYSKTVSPDAIAKQHPDVFCTKTLNKGLILYCKACGGTRTQAVNLTCIATLPAMRLSTPPKTCFHSFASTLSNCPLGTSCLTLLLCSFHHLLRWSVLFSVLKSMFSDDQRNTLLDTMELCLMKRVAQGIPRQNFGISVTD